MYPAVTTVGRPSGTTVRMGESTMTRTLKMAAATAAFSVMTLAASGAWAVSCPVSYGQLKAALVSAANADSTGLNNNYWGVVVNRRGEVCVVAYSGPSIGSQWLLSRQIAAAKAWKATEFDAGFDLTCDAAELVVEYPGLATRLL